MKYNTVRIEGAILSADILDKIEQGEIAGQSPKDFGFNRKTKVKDEIARAWADAQDLWRVFKRQREKVAEKEYGTTETRRYWIVPLLGLLDYDIQLSKAETVFGKSYAVSHRASNLDGFPVHIVGFNDSLDKKRDEGGTRMSPHALLQEYINLTEHLYTIVTNGIHLRLLRDSSRLIKQSFIEFDLESVMEEEQFADFAIMYRLLHATRMPAKMDLGADSLIEKYHQDALDSGARIREGLSIAVEFSIRSLANGFLEHPQNQALREQVENGEISATDFYQYLLRLIYRFLFLLVIEERNLIFPVNGNKKNRDIYYKYYSLNRLRALCDKPYLADHRFNDLWISLKNTFQLFENQSKGKHLKIPPLAGDLFGHDALGPISECQLNNKILLECIKSLSTFTNQTTGQKMRINYAALNVEEFGSVYEGLLEFEPKFSKQNGTVGFDLVKGSERSSSGSHYTPDELVQPLIKHSLDYIIEDKLNTSKSNPDKEKALLSIKVCDVACGSGHILLNAARRIGTDLARVRTGEDQPSPVPLRQAIRDVINSCIYGVDKNPLAVELCKVALWLEAHNPGKPLNFLNNHIKCGDAIVGLAHKEVLENGIPDEAFKNMPGDDKGVRSELAKRNKRERKNSKQNSLDFNEKIGGSLESISKLMEKFNQLPENTPEEIEHKKKTYARMTKGETWLRLKQLADIQVAQFFINKTETNVSKIVTDEEYRDYLNGEKQVDALVAEKAERISKEKKFFHWFLEFPIVFAQGGFDCILGNPPFLGDKKIKRTFGGNYIEYFKFAFRPAGACDIVAYFFRRIFSIISSQGKMGLISTNSISQGVTKAGSLDVICDLEGNIIFASPSIKWPGKAAVIVSLVAIVKGSWNKNCNLNNREVSSISSLLQASDELGSPYQLICNQKKAFTGSYVLGNGFVLEENQATMLRANNKNCDVIYPYINGSDLNNHPRQEHSKYIINFFDWDEEKAKEYPDCYNIVKEKVKPQRDKVSRKRNREKWWLYAENRPGLYSAIRNQKQVLCVAQVSKTLAFCFLPNNMVYDTQLTIFAFEDFYYFAILQSNFHYNWAWKYCTTMKNDLRYVIKNVFETYPFPQNINKELFAEINKIGNEYHLCRSQIMNNLQIGLTKLYNQFHNPELKGLSDNDIQKIKDFNKKDLQKEFGAKIANLIAHVKMSNLDCNFGNEVENIIKLRELHKKMDEAVLQAYGWGDIDLVHDFYEVDYLPENDRIRYTISPDARKEVLKRLLKLNHEIHEKEIKAGLNTKGKKAKNKENDDTQQMMLF